MLGNQGLHDSSPINGSLPAPYRWTGLIELKYSKNIDTNEMAAIKQRFNNFPRWWLRMSGI
jgi:hypothetical protein